MLGQLHDHLTWRIQDIKFFPMGGKRLIAAIRNIDLICQIFADQREFPTSLRESGVSVEHEISLLVGVWAVQCREIIATAATQVGRQPQSPIPGRQVNSLGTRPS